MNTLIKIGLAGLCLSTAACATQRYGRQQSLTDAERRHYSCEQIAIEIEKCESFIQETTEHKERLTGKDVLSFLGDFGIGDSMEYSEAVESGTRRIEQLRALEKDKGCTSTAPPN